MEPYCLNRSLLFSTDDAALRGFAVRHVRYWESDEFRGMKLIQIFLPRYDNGGRRIAKGLFATERQRLVERFGGMTAHVRAPAIGLWKDGPVTKRDEIVIYEVIARRVDRKWWMSYRRRLQKRFRQKQILVRIQDIKIL